MRWVHVVVVAGAVWLCANRSESSVLYTMDSGIGTLPGGTLYQVDQTDGHTTPVWRVGARNAVDLASDWRPESARLWVGDFRSQALFVVTASDVALVGTMNASVFTLAFDPKTDRLFGVSRDFRLYQVDTATAACALVGQLVLGGGGGLPAPDSLAFDLNGVLWAGDGGRHEIYTINPATAVTTLVKTIPAFAMADIAFRPEDGVMFGISNYASRSVYRIDVAAGTVTPISPGVTEIAGAAFLPILVPEPAAGGIALVLSTASLCRRGRRRPMSATSARP